MQYRVCPTCGKSEKEDPEEFGLGGRIKLCWACYTAEQATKLKIERMSLEYRQQRSKYYQEWYRKNGRKRASDYGSVIMVWARGHPEARKAGIAVQQAIRDGILSRPDFCSLCGRQAKIAGHHQNYDEALEVVWVCASCHRKIHNSMKRVCLPDKLTRIERMC